MFNINCLVDFELEGYQNSNIEKYKLSNYRGKWIILLFYPADFSFICPTEIREASLNYNDVKELNAEIFSISVDPVYSHKTWHEESDIIRSVQFPMLSDPKGDISKKFNIFNEDKSFSERATFIIDPDGYIKSIEICEDRIGRNFDETLRKLKALIFVYQNQEKNVGCPASWRPGDKGVKMKK